MIEKYFKAILDNSPESIVLIGKNHEVLAYNKTIKDVLFQYFNREIKEGDFYYPDFVVEPNQKLYLEAYNSAIRGQPFWVQNLTKNENISYWFEYKMQPVYDENELLGVTLSAKNITTEKEAELKIIDLSEKLKAILDNTDESIILLDLNYKILAINKIATNTIKHDTNTGTILGRDFREFITDKSNLFYEYYPKAINGENSLIEIPYQNTLGELLWYQTKFNLVYDQNKQPIGVSIFAKDISEKKILELSLKESEERFRKITALAPIGILITNAAFDITYANLAAKNMLKYTDDEMYLRSIIHVIGNFKLSNEHKLRIDDLNVDIESPIFNQEQFFAITKDDAKLNILLSSSSFFNQSKQSYIFIIQDYCTLLFFIVTKL
jgi:two-component system, sporulation sensor kinase E